MGYHFMRFPFSKFISLTNLYKMSCIIIIILLLQCHEKTILINYSYMYASFAVFISPEGALHLEGALKVAADMIRSRPSDLREVCAHDPTCYL